jgi:5-methylcytosine-specific restriction endonuclease McrA
MTRSKYDLNVQVVLEDKTFELKTDPRTPQQKLWIGKCIHCNTPITLKEDGTPLSATLEHIVPQCHGGTNDPSNLSFACASCNNTKGRKIDKLSTSHPKYQEVVRFLLEKKQSRLRKK